MQIGEGSHEARVIVSTVAEAEHILPLLQEYKQAGREVNVSIESGSNRIL